MLIRVSLIHLYIGVENKSESKMFVFENLKKSILLSLLVISLFIFTNRADAEYFVWEDPHTGVTLSFPDTWYMTSKREDDEIIRINAPGAKISANCVVKHREDKRFLIYPSRYDDAIQKIAYSKDFWTQYFSKHDNVKVHLIRDGAGFAKGYASYIIASYTTGYPEVYEERVSVAFTGYYAGNNLIGECSSSKEEFPKYRDIFLSVLKSVDQDKINHELLIGEYENFLGSNAILYFRDKSKLKTEQY